MDTLGTRPGRIAVCLIRTQLPARKPAQPEPARGRKSSAPATAARKRSAQTRMPGALRIVFMRHRPAKVDQKTVAEVLGDGAVKPLDDLGTGLFASHHFHQGHEVRRGEGMADDAALRIAAF